MFSSSSSMIGSDSNGIRAHSSISIPLLSRHCSARAECLLVSAAIDFQIQLNDSVKAAMSIGTIPALAG